MPRRCRRVPALATENENDRPIAVPIDEALAALERGTLHNGPLIMALQWLALNRTRLHEIVAAGIRGERI